MLYQSTRALLKIALAVFFKKIVVTGHENIPDNGPMIIVANHPNTLMDPLIVATNVKQQVGFIANASIFGHRILDATFRHFHVIPIYRKKDVANGKKEDNSTSFRKCHEFLKEGGTLLIFPEGESIYELNLREIKTGTARIALSYEMFHQFQGNLKIVTVALDYSDSIQFRSIVSATFFPPKLVSEFKDEYLKDQETGIRALTEYIRSTLARRVPQTSGKEQEDYLIKVHKFYTAYSEPGAELYENPKRSLELRKQLSTALKNTEQSNPAFYQEIKIMVFNFFKQLQSAKLTTGFFKDEFQNKKKSLLLLGYLTEFVILAPIYLTGYLTNVLPYLLPGKIFSAMKIDIEYKTPVELLCGIVLFPLFYMLELLLIRNYLDLTWITSILVLLLFPVSGFIALYYHTELQRFARMIRYLFINSDTKQAILTMRNQILEKITNARDTIRSNNER